MVLSPGAEKSTCLTLADHEVHGHKHQLCSPLNRSDAQARSGSALGAGQRFWPVYTDFTLTPGKMSSGWGSSPEHSYPSWPDRSSASRTALHQLTVTARGAVTPSAQTRSHQAGRNHPTDSSTPRPCLSREAFLHKYTNTRTQHGGDYRITPQLISLQLPPARARARPRPQAPGPRPCQSPGNTSNSCCR